jgi:hypothetical protein
MNVTLLAVDAPHSNIAPQLQGLAIPIGDVELHPRNPRRGDVVAVTASLRRFGQRKPIVVQASTRYVVAGNHLLLAARALHWTEVAANVQEMDDAEATAFMLADNRTSDLGGYDDGLLAAILSEQAASDNLDATGYDNDAVAALLQAAGLDDRTADPDAVPALPAPADLYVKPGDLFSLGRHRLICGDATDPTTVRRVTGGASVDLVWVDPVYGVNYSGKTAEALTIANDDLGADGTRELVAAALKLAPLALEVGFPTPRFRHDMPQVRRLVCGHEHADGLLTGVGRDPKCALAMARRCQSKPEPSAKGPGSNATARPEARPFPYEQEPRVRQHEARTDRGRDVVDQLLGLEGCRKRRPEFISGEHEPFWPLGTPRPQEGEPGINPPRWWATPSRVRSGFDGGPAPKPRR